MKAKHWIKKFEEDTSPKAVKDNMVQLAGELEDLWLGLVEKRNVGTVKGMLNCIRQSDEKYRAVARAVPVLDNNGFLKLTIKRFEYTGDFNKELSDQLCRKLYNIIEDNEMC